MIIHSLGGGLGLHEVAFPDDEVHLLLALPLADGDEAHGEDATPEEEDVEEGKVLDQPDFPHDVLELGDVGAGQARLQQDHRRQEVDAVDLGQQQHQGVSGQDVQPPPSQHEVEEVFHVDGE